MSEHFIINDTIMVDFISGEISHNTSGRVYRIGSNESELLKYFLLHPQQVISRQVLNEQVWLSKGVVVEDGSLMQAISLCRKALEDSNGLLIVTERGQGYRFKGEVKTRQQDSGSLSKISPSIALVSIALLFASFALSYFFFSKPSSSNALEMTQYSQCVIQSQELASTQFKGVSLYQYQGKQILVDEVGRSLTLPLQSGGVNCE
ncbi:transcriptional regulator [Vibrio breoganii]